MPRPTVTIAPLGGGSRLLPWSWVLGLFLLMLPALLRAGFALDDRELLFENPVTDGSVGLWGAFTRDYFHHLGDSGQWRPMASLSLRLDRLLFGTWATGYHLTNGLLQLAVVVCAAGLLERSRLPRSACRLGLVLFALHPALADSVVWIAGRTSMLAALFPLSGFWLGSVLLERSRWRSASLCGGLGLLFGLLCKEDALVFALLLPCLAGGVLTHGDFDQLRVRRFALGASGLAALVLLVWCLGRFFALGTPFPHATSPVLGAASLGERLIVGGAAWIEGLRLALWPADYPPQYRPAFLASRNTVLGSPETIAVLGWALGCLPLVLLWVRRPLTPWVLSGLFASLSFLPVTQLVPSGEVFAPRFLYLPLLFAIPLFGAVLDRLAPKTPNPWKALVLAFALCAGLTLRAGIYRDAGTWRAEMLHHHPEDAPSWNALGLWREESGDESAAQAAWEHAIRLDPKYSRSWSNLGRLQLSQGDLSAAEATLRSALRVGPQNPVPRVNLASLLARQDKHAESAELYRAATQLAPGLGAAWRGLGSALSQLDQPEPARLALERALELDPNDRAAHTLLRRLAPTGSAAPLLPQSPVNSAAEASASPTGPSKESK